MADDHQFLLALEHVLLHPRDPPDVDSDAMRTLRLVDRAARARLVQHIVCLRWDDDHSELAFKRVHAALVGRAPCLRVLHLESVTLRRRWKFGLTLARATALRELHLHAVVGLRRNALFDALAALPSLKELHLSCMDLAAAAVPAAGPSAAGPSAAGPSAAGPSVRALDMSRLTALTHLSLLNTLLPGFEEAIGQLTGLRSLGLELDKCVPHDAAVLGRSVASLGCLEVLHCWKDTRDGVLAKLRGSTAPLRELRASLQDGAYEGASGIPELLASRPHAGLLDTLQLSCGLVATEHWRSLALLGALTQLTDLDLSFNFHEDGGGDYGGEWDVVADTAASLARLTRLSKLNLGGFMDMASEREAAWLGMLSGMTALQTLVLWVNDRGTRKPEEAAAAAAVCKELATRLSASRAPLQELCVSHSGMGRRGMQSLARPLAALEADTLVTLNLLAAGLGRAGCEHLAQVLARHAARLRNLELGDNRICTDGLAALAPALRSMARLRALGLADNLLDDSGAALLADCVRCMPKLRVLLLGNHQLRSNAVELMCRSVAGNRRLELIDLSFDRNEQPDEQEVERLEALTEGTTVFVSAEHIDCLHDVDGFVW